MECNETLGIKFIHGYFVVRVEENHNKLTQLHIQIHFSVQKVLGALPQAQGYTDSVNGPVKSQVS